MTIPYNIREIMNEDALNDREVFMDKFETVSDVYVSEDNLCRLASCFMFSETPQGHKFWAAYAYDGRPYDKLLDEALEDLVNAMDDYRYERWTLGETPQQEPQEERVLSPKFLAVQALMSELVYQEREGANDNNHHIKPKMELGEIILAIDFNLNAAKTQWYHGGNIDPKYATEFLRKIAALAVMGMEYGVDPREGIDDYADAAE